MAPEWAPAVLAAGAAGCLGAALWALWKVAPDAESFGRRIGRERVRLPLPGGPGAGKHLWAWVPSAMAAAALYLLVAALARQAGLAAAFALGGLMVPGWVRAWRETRRLLQLSDQLDHAMALVSASLRRGTPLEVAIAEAAGTTSAPLGPVLRRLAEATVLGVTLAQAVEQVRSLPAVAGNADFQVFATEMVVCQERGANVVQAFAALRQVLAARRRYRAQVREHMGQHLLQSLVIAGVGFGVLALYAELTPEGLAPLLESAVGQTLLAASVLGNTFLIRLTHLSLLRQLRRV